LPVAVTTSSWLMGVGTNSGANLSRADLTSARLAAAVFPGANLTGADLTGLHPNDDASLDMRLRLANAVLADANLTGARWSEGVQVPDGWMIDGDSGRLKRAGQLSAAVPLGGSRIREKIRDGVRRRSLLGSWSCCGAAAARACGFGDDDAGCP
jgi:hypothetical protein